LRGVDANFHIVYFVLGQDFQFGESDCDWLARDVI